jgi:hypothetical protein
MNSEIFMANSYSPPLENPMPHILFPALHSLSDEDARQATADRALSFKQRNTGARRRQARSVGGRI